MLRGQQHSTCGNAAHTAHTAHQNLAKDAHLELWPPRGRTRAEAMSGRWTFEVAWCKGATLAMPTMKSSSPTPPHPTPTLSLTA